MNLPFFNGINKRMREADDELQNYFNASREFRINCRKDGWIIIVGVKQDLFDLIKFVTEKCEIEIKLTHLPDVEAAKTLLGTTGSQDVRALVIDFDALSSLDQDNFLSWIGDNYPDIPLFVSQCLPQFEQRVRKCRYSTRIFVEGQTKPEDYVDALCLPPECKEYIPQYQSASA